MTASLWLESRDLLEEALKYAILSKDMTFAVSLLDNHRLRLHNAEHFLKLERLIRMFPENVVEDHLELLLSLVLLQERKAN